LTVNVPLAKLALPATPTEPTSPSHQAEAMVGGVVTVRVIVAVCVKLPDVPVMLTGTVPVVAVLLAVSVNVLVAVAGFGLNDAVTPLGRPDADKLTAPLKPFCGETVTVLVLLAPWIRTKLLGDVERV
jgi:hypothetical protein